MSAPRQAAVPAVPSTVDELGTAITPRVRTVLRRLLFWGVLATVLLLVLLAVTSVQQVATPDVFRDPTSTGGSGSRAVEQVLEQQGVHVTIADDYATAVHAADDRAHTTLLVDDDFHALPLSGWSQIFTLGVAHVVLVEPEPDLVQPYLPGIGVADEVQGDFTAGCPDPTASRAGTVTSTGLAYHFTGSGAACYGRGDSYGLIQAQYQGTAVTVLGLGDVLQNDTVATQGDAALALGLLGDQPNLVWYRPGLSLTTPAPQTLAQLTPPWVTPLVALFYLVAIVAILWRARRVGPVVVERLPVVVPASETTDGRARMYQRSGARRHALDALRIGTLDRLAVRLGLPRVATVDEIIAALVNQTGEPRDILRRLLVDAVPASDADLVKLSDALLDLERRVATATRPNPGGSSA